MIDYIRCAICSFCVVAGLYAVFDKAVARLIGFPCYCCRIFRWYCTDIGHDRWLCIRNEYSNVLNKTASIHLRLRYRVVKLCQVTHVVTGIEVQYMPSSYMSKVC